MKKFIYPLILYIGLCITVFNPVTVHAQINIPLPFSEELSNLSFKQTEQTNQPKNQFLKLIAAFYIVDYLYPNKEINQDITGLLHKMWPQTEIEKLEKFSKYLKKIIMLKRRYVYAIDHLKQKIKASNLLLPDAPIIAKNGEFAPKFSDERKAADSTDYKIKYIPYKYIGYDKGEYGEAVRRRDKNYEPVSASVVDEITLALLQFNLGAFYRALKKLPKQNDGSREKFVELGEDIHSRLVMDTMALGQKETVKGFLEVYVPQGLYINGDYLNTKVKPQFMIDESTKEDTNIKDYQLYYPEALGVQNGKETSRILVGSVRFPIEISRRDLNKDINIKSTFTFQVCQAKTKNCRPIISHNSLTLITSLDEMPSMHINAVNIAFARLPKEQTKHATVKEAVYNPNTQTLTVKFKTNKSFSNVAAMAEDANETNFFNPQYKIEKDEITATFHTGKSSTIPQPVSQSDVGNEGEIAITAAFDEYEVLRKVITPTINNNLTQPDSSAPYDKAFLFALILPFMPGLFYLLQNLLILFIFNPYRRSVLIQFICGSLIGTIALAYYNRLYNWPQIYENSWVIVSASLLTVSLLMQNFNYMDFELFRPLRGKIKRGFFIGLFSVLLIAAAPILQKEATFNAMYNLSLESYIKTWTLIWITFQIIPLLCYVFRDRLYSMPIKMYYFNRGYTFIYLLLIIITAFFIRGCISIIILTIGMCLMAFLWYIYPIAVNATIIHRRSKKGKREVFKKVQHHGTIITSVIWLFTAIAFNMINIKNPVIPSPETILNKAQDSLKKNKPILFILHAPWSPQSWINKIQLKELNQNKIEIIQYNPPITNKYAALWYRKYQKNTLPIHVLFTPRHPYGLQLPENFKKIDWNEALSYYITLPEKKE